MNPTYRRPTRPLTALSAALPCALFIAGALIAPAAPAAGFSPLSQSRAVQMAGEIVIVDLNTQQAFTDSLAPAAQTLPADFGTFDESVGLGELSLLVPDLGEAYGAGRAAQTSSIAAQAIRFNGMADVFMSGQLNGAADLLATGTSSSRFDIGFSVAQSLQVDLSMTSEVGSSNSLYTFSLTQDAGPVVWDQTVLLDDQGAEIRTFSQRLTLGPGNYRLQATLNASSVFTNDSGTSGRALAEFSLVTAPVPEPGAAALLLAGLLTVGAMVRKHRADR